ncbi:chromosomal replication initiator protein DnaA, partial [bacterium]|nr:chromosomal replication initiator protein DnaA [bacterium]
MQNKLKIWSDAKSIIKSRIGEIAFNTWFGPIKIKVDKTKNFTIELPDNFFKEWFINHYLELTNSVIRDLGG